MLEQALFDTLVGAHIKEVPLTEHTDRLIDQLVRSVDRGAITARQESCGQRFQSFKTIKH